MEESKEGLLIYINKYQYRSTVAILSFQDTLVDRFYNIVRDLSKLKELHSNGCSVIVHDYIYLKRGQAKTRQLESLKMALDKICNSMRTLSDIEGIPLMCVFYTSVNRYAKPLTNVLTKIDSLYKEAGCLPPNYKKGLVIGAGAGRISGTVDRSDIDRAFAYNCNMAFCVDDMFFGRNVAYRWKWSSLTSKDLFTVNIDPALLSRLKSTINRYHIIITGPPCSGKTTLLNELASKSTLVFDETNIEYSYEDNLKNLDFDQMTKLGSPSIIATRAITSTVHVHDCIIDLMGVEKTQQDKKIFLFIEMKATESMCIWLNYHRLQGASNSHDTLERQKISQFFIDKDVVLKDELLKHKDNTKFKIGYLEYPVSVHSDYRYPIV